MVMISRAEPRGIADNVAVFLDMDELVLIWASQDDDNLKVKVGPEEKIQWEWVQLGPCPEAIFLVMFDPLVNKLWAT